MNSLDWSRKYEVLGISRLYLRSIGFTIKDINSLSERDMWTLADLLNSYYTVGFDQTVKFVVQCFFVERGVPSPRSSDNGTVA